MDTYVYFYTFIFVYFSKTNKSLKNYNVVLNIIFYMNLQNYFGM